ncbi:hypothetical protein NM208_g5340 [Fusarium decemcellulare]|uniref:Uncharacterized protein n=2 Tax=Fusarium decemcellulare TaxID=57161 RepID=A0ACC1SHH0_9HYPO|nr:hypothetical protein NM208_g5391 [Fusarium decemcellulare]KAJ3539808.1 hypothetical protein NM208_g5340 [Fusarium decemcellulare]
MNLSLAVAGLLLLSLHSLRLSDAVDLGFSQTRDRSSGLCDVGIFCGLAPKLNYVLIDNVHGHPDVFGPHPTFHDHVRLSLLGAHFSVALPVTPYAVSIPILAVVLAMIATEQLNVRQELLSSEDSRPPPRADRTHVLDSYNESLQNNWVDVTHYRCTVSVLDRLYLIATLEHTLFWNRSEKGQVLDHGLQLLQPVVILSIACILRGLAYSWFMQEEERDAMNDDDTHLELFQRLLQPSNKPGTVRASLAKSISFDTQILSVYFNVRGASSTKRIRSGISPEVQMLVRSH